MYIFVIFVEGHSASGVARQGGFFLPSFSNFCGVFDSVGRQQRCICGGKRWVVRYVIAVIVSVFVLGTQANQAGKTARCRASEVCTAARKRGAE